MLKEVFLFALVAIYITTANCSFYYTELTADKDFLLKQKKIYNLFYHASQPNVVNEDLYKQGLDYSIEANIDSYTNKEAVNDFIELYKFGFLPRGELFSVYYPKLLAETKSLFKLFYYAKDFDTFFKTALWARVNINQGEFFLALYQAVLRRPDTIYIQLPPPYEFYPYAFFNSEVIEAAKNVKLYNKPDTLEGNSYIIHANFSGWYLNRDYDTEMKLKYFMEDISLNTYYFFFRENNPFWLSSDEFGLDKHSRGEEYLYGHKQLFNRYNLERLANGLEKVEDFTWDSEFYPGYYPTMVYHNGLPYPQRPHWSKIPQYKYPFLHAIHDAESRISGAIDSGIVLSSEGKPINIYTHDGLNILGNLIEGNEDSFNRNFYRSIDEFARRILGFNLEPKSQYQVIPSAMESLFSCMRDPAFYRLYKRIGYYYYRYKELLKPYPKDEVVFPGLKFESLTTEKLVTYFDYFDATISNGLPVHDQKEADSLFIKVRQHRLNHKPFNVNMIINSDKPQPVAIQLFLGPKYDGQHNLIDFTESYRYFYEIDYWVTDLIAGENKLERNSHDFFFLMPDKEPSEIFYKRVENALEGTEQFTYKQNLYGFPEHLLLPKGSRAGSTYQLFAYVSPVAEVIKYKSRVFGSYMFSHKAMGFPLDRPIYYPHFQGPNMFFKDVNIYLNLDVDPNATV
ncbi:arylphorin subunit alpha [Microplitis demolitor]|uniref:arylphorin subunit alpha n=1 Tax=Microplitis demolitor TaxID=69319 RepID=UPI0004CCC3BD|nr:arylphorin subunit alpha [Microplitis demolitor]